MGYIVGQYNQPNVNAESTDSDTNKIYMTQLTSGGAGVRVNLEDSRFEDECVYASSLVDANKNYYLHSWIKRLDTKQTFKIYLVQYDPELDDRVQFLKTVEVEPITNSSSWYDFNIIFTPLINFDCILFELVRIGDDYITPRKPIIIYEELSLINNLITTITPGIKFIKLGLTSRPGLITCMNGEEIHIGNTGIYEFKNGIITIDFFSAINTAIEENSFNPNNYNSSTCIFSNSKLRAIDAFTLDYMYRGTGGE